MSGRWLVVGIFFFASVLTGRYAHAGIHFIGNFVHRLAVFSFKKQRCFQAFSVGMMVPPG